VQDIEKAIEQDSGEALPQGAEEVEFTDDEMDDNSALSLADEKHRLRRAWEWLVQPK